MLWQLIKTSNTAKVVLLVIIAALVWWFNWYAAVGLLVLLFADIAVMFGFTPRHNGDYVYSKDILSLFSLQGDKLRVGMEQGDISAIEQIKLFEQDQFGYIDFSLNAELQVRYKFPLQQYQPLLQWLQQQMPETNITAGFNS
ncbi:hypothetical protein [Rheinheimera nanhaiensis]|uniref:Uncharacterized protein n=1 Tax=Rheinheimera nanhaiensis E407-8 TaxID=562729 RepID=I1DZV8_9GAMM|nr:hypothetical protein [Rheinheimera nanhaiensis]GAB59586.1 hypothetical protein RNAN_2592 [Rheinheimera nanhaiensis E407-8]